MDQFTLFVLLSPLGCTVAILVAVFGWQRRSARGGRQLAVTMSSVAAYLLFNTLELVDPTPAGTLFFARLSYIWISILTISWLAFALAFSNREHWPASPYFRLLGIIPTITVALVFTNEYHHLIWQKYVFIPVTNGYLYLRVITYGGWFWVFWLQAYLLILSAAGMLIWRSFSPGRRFRMQARLTVAAALLPLVVNLVYVLRLIPGFIKDYSPLSYAFSGILLAVSIFRYRMLDLQPFARAILIDNMTDGMLTLDTARRVVDHNPAAQRMFALTSLPVPHRGEPFPILDSYLDQFKESNVPELLQAELVLPHPQGDSFYDLQIRCLRDQRDGEVIGYLALLHTITEHKKLLQAVRKQAEEDRLTGVLNRNRFVELAKEEIEAARAGPLHFSILMIDIDNFKQVNDTMGHLCGDQLLQAFAQRLRVLLRSGDLIGRIGGDEFIVLLPDTPLERAFQLAERLCRQMAAASLETEDYGDIPITISAGVAEYFESKSGTLDPVISVADKGLYQAKARGRNQACVFDPEYQQ